MHGIWNMYSSLTFCEHQRPTMDAGECVDADEFRSNTSIVNPDREAKPEEPPIQRDLVLRVFR
jgi:hypothetical protein